MKKKYLLFFIPLLLLFCKRNEVPEILIDSTGTIIKKPHLWKVPLSDGNYITTFISSSIIFNDCIVMGAYKNHKCEIALVDVENGEKQWQKPYSDRDFAAIDFVYQHENYIIAPGVTDDFLKLNIETGEIVWTINKPNLISNTVTGIDDTYFFGAQSEFTKSSYHLWAGWYGNTGSTDLHEFLTPVFSETADTININYNGNIKVGGIDRILPFKSVSGDIMLLITSFKTLESIAGEYYFSFYNFTKKEFVYKEVRLSALLCGSPQIVDNKIYFTLNKEVCSYDLYTGMKLWSKPYPNAFSGQGFIISEGKLVAMEQNLGDSYLICLNIETGEQNWRIPSKQLILGPMRYMNGAIYFVSSEDHKLHAYDAANGKELWRITSPDYEHDSGAFFKPECTVVPGKDGAKGKVIVSSYLSAFCYEAIK